MQRDTIEALKNWKQSTTRKPLLLRGARQVGKTWLLQEFGRTCYKNCVYINFEETISLQMLFVNDIDIKHIITTLEIHSGTAITPNDTLIIFDEIQAAERALTSLKYFCENAPQYHIVAAGSLLGITMPYKTSFPVGKVDFIDLHPLSFTEYLKALGEHKLVELLQENNWNTIQIFKEKIQTHLRSYFFVGGMPEVVNNFAQNKNYDDVRLIQKRILQSYEGDFSKHAPHAILPRIKMVWQSIPAQLSKENKKFIYGVIREGARAKDFELAIQWLVDAGLLIKNNRISKPEMPLTAFEDFFAFKLYLHDIGLFSALCGIDSKTLIQGNELYLQFKGAITEQYVMQQLHLFNSLHITYWSNERSTSEVDFVIQYKGKIIPIEVKAEENLKSKSFKLFCETYKPEHAFRVSLANYKKESWMTNIPLFSIEFILKLIV